MCWAEELIYWLRLCLCWRAQGDEEDYVAAVWCCWHSRRLYSSDMPRLGCVPTLSVSKCVYWGGGGGEGEFERSVEELWGCVDSVVCVYHWAVGKRSGGPAGSLWLQCAPRVSGLVQILSTATAGTWEPTKTGRTNTQRQAHTHANKNTQTKDSFYFP